MFQYDTIKVVACVHEHIVIIMQIGHTWAGMIRAYICVSPVCFFYIAALKAESRPTELYRERASVWEQWVEVKAMSHHQAWDALFFKRRRLRRADWLLRRRKNKWVVFLIKEALKERVGVLGSFGGWPRSKQAESFPYTHFLWSGHFGSEYQGEIMCLVYAVLHHLSSHSMHSHTQSYYTCTPMRTHSSRLAHTCAIFTHAHMLIQELTGRTVAHTHTQYIDANICTVR